MGLNVSTDDKGLKIWRNDEGQYPRYSYTISRKNQDGTWDNCYQSVRFKKDVSVSNGVVIKINNAFFSFDTAKDDPKKKYPYLMVTDFSVISEPEPEISIPESAGDADVVPFK
jgi:hypothetical protein